MRHFWKRNFHIFALQYFLVLKLQMLKLNIFLLANITIQMTQSSINPSLFCITMFNSLYFCSHLG